MGATEDAWRIEPMRSEDLAAVGAIEKESFRTAWTEAAFLGELRNPRARCVVAWHEGELVGYACYWVLGEELLINNLAVGLQWRRRGLGGCLMSHAIQDGYEAGCRVAFLEVRDSNLGARQLYENHGFRVIRRRRGYYADTGQDALIMCASLKGLETG